IRYTAFTAVTLENKLRQNADCCFAKIYQPASCQVKDSYQEPSLSDISATIASSNILLSAFDS
ncbi:hypothetical protein J7438_26905, partial [Thalassotalea sp. G20_0]|uniref:hypothetical protein n=1 Tax=Thalassotalea sp. G20_0 TaxID=2821093 RepID=UPI001AD9BC54